MYQVQCCFTSTQTIRAGEKEIIYQVQCCFKFNVANMLLASEDIKQKELYVLRISGTV